MVWHFPDRLVTTQAMAAVAAIVALALWPPASGRLLLVPLGPADPGAVVRAAASAGALLLGAGPLAGSEVVIGDRTALRRQASPWRILILAAPPAGCRGFDLAGPR